MSVSNLKCSECDAVTTDVCPECHETPLCTACIELVHECGGCDDFDEDVDEDEDEEEEGEEEEEDEGGGWPAPERDA